MIDRYDPWEEFWEKLTSLLFSIFGFLIAIFVIANVGIFSASMHSIAKSQKTIAAAQTSCNVAK